MTIDTLAEQVKKHRINKGWSQELLAENTGLSLRTIQRIEKGSTIPRGDTLNKLSLVLQIDKPAYSDHLTPRNKSYIVILHFSALSFLLFPILGIVMPLLLWLLNKEKIDSRSAKDLINFQMTWTIILFIVYYAVYQWITFKINSSEVISISLINENYQYLYAAVGILYIYNLAFIIYNIYFLKNSSKIKYQPKINFIQ